MQLQSGGQSIRRAYTYIPSICIAQKFEEKGEGVIENVQHQ